jgi:hypothetical protein
MTLQEKFTKRRGRYMLAILASLVVLALSTSLTQHHSIGRDLVALVSFIGALAWIVALCFGFRCPRCGHFVSPAWNPLSPNPLDFRRYCKRCGLDFAAISADETPPSNKSLQPTAGRRNE